MRSSWSPSQGYANCCTLYVCLFDGIVFFSIFFCEILSVLVSCKHGFRLQHRNESETHRLQLLRVIMKPNKDGRYSVALFVYECTLVLDRRNNSSYQLGQYHYCWRNRGPNFNRGDKQEFFISPYHLQTINEFIYYFHKNIFVNVCILWIRCISSIVNMFLLTVVPTLFIIEYF